MDRIERTGRRCRDGLLMSALTGVLVSTALAAGPDESKSEAASPWVINSYVSAYSATSNQDLDDRQGIHGACFGGTLRYVDEGMSLFIDGETNLLTGEKALNNSRGLREAYAQYAWSSGSVRAGRQIVAWGRADEFNPTDVVTPFHYGKLTVAQGERRVGAGAVKITQSLTDAVTAQWVVLPSFSASTLPAERGLSSTLPDVKTEKPDVSASRPETGLRFDVSSMGVDAGLYVYQGHSRLGLTSVTPAGVAKIYPELALIGADFTTTVGSWGLRGEWAFTHYARDEVTRTGVGDNHYLVLGLEKELNEGSIIAQWLQRQVTSRPVAGSFDITGDLTRYNRLVAGQSGMRSTAVNLNWDARWYDGRVETRLSVLRGLEDHDTAWRATVRYALTDTWSLQLIGEQFRGSPESLLGSQRKNNVLYVALRHAL